MKSLFFTPDIFILLNNKPAICRTPIYLFLLLIIVALGGGCKSSKKITKNTVKQQDVLDSVTEEIIAVSDTSVNVTKVVEVQDSVDINVHRLLKDTLHIIGVGDIMMGTNFPNTSYLPPSNGKNLLIEVDSILNSADVTFGNLEGVILNEGGQQKHCKNPDVCYLFRSPESYLSLLKKAGFDVLSTANNHAGDFGNIGRKNTAKVLDSLELYHAGQLSHPYATFKKNGMKYGFTAFSPNAGTLSIHNYKKATEIIQHLDNVSDVVIVSFHGGAEGNKHQRVTRQTETFYGENRGNVYEFSHLLIDAGADVIFGHGPHVTRAVEIYKDRFIAYSLGNFCTYARFNLRGVNGIAPIIDVMTDSSGAFIKATITPIVQYGRGGPRIDPQRRVIKLIQELTKKDFPDLPINIDNQGVITYIRN